MHQTGLRKSRIPRTGFPGTFFCQALFLRKRQIMIEQFAKMTKIFTNHITSQTNCVKFIIYTEKFKLKIHFNKVYCHGIIHVSFFFVQDIGVGKPHIGIKVHCATNKEPSQKVKGSHWGDYYLANCCSGKALISPSTKTMHTTLVLTNAMITRCFHVYDHFVGIVVLVKNLR